MKRTNMRSNPEDAEYYRRFRDRTWQMVSAGMAPEKAVQKLVEQGVPEETARRIVRGAEQEVSLGKSEPAASFNPMLLVAAVGLPLLLLGVLYGSSTGSSLGSPRTLVKAAGLVVVCAILLGALWRGRSKK